MVFTDPPYGVTYDAGKRLGGKDWGVIKNDMLQGKGLEAMLLGAYKNMEKHTVDAPAIYICYASNNHIQFELALLEA